MTASEQNEWCKESRMSQIISRKEKKNKNQTHFVFSISHSTPPQSPSKITPFLSLSCHKRNQTSFGWSSLKISKYSFGRPASVAIVEIKMLKSEMKSKTVYKRIPSLENKKKMKTCVEIKENEIFTLIVEPLCGWKK